MRIYRTKVNKLRGTDYREIHKKARFFYEQIKRASRRKPYMRSAYFKKEKVFLGLFWSHLYEKKNYWDQMRRLKFFPCALELIRYSHCEPTSKENPNKPSELLHRFTGMTPEKDLFFVQIKEDKSSGKKWLISAFPLD